MPHYEYHMHSCPTTPQVLQHSSAPTQPGWHHAGSANRGKKIAGESNRGGRRGDWLLGQGAQAGLRVRWLMSEYLVLRAGGCWFEVNKEFRHAGSGRNLRSGACCRCFGPALSPITPPRCWDAARRAPGHMALASPSMWMWMAAAVQTVECNSTWSLSLGFFCAALVPWVVLIDSTYWPRQRLAWVAAFP